MKILKELIEFFYYNKKLWLLPLVFLLLIIGFLLTVAQGSVFAPFIYTLF